MAYYFCIALIKRFSCAGPGTYEDIFDEQNDFLIIHNQPHIQKLVFIQSTDDTRRE